MTTEHFIGGQEREVRKVFVVDRVELCPPDQLEQMRDLDGDRPARSQEYRQAVDEAVEVRDVR